MKQQSTDICTRQTISHIDEVSDIPKAWTENKMLKGLICLIKPSFKKILFLVLVANVIFDVQMSTPSPVKLLRGHTLTLNCTATTALNTRVQMTWSYPGKVSDQFFYFFYKIVFLLSNEMPLCFCSGKNQNVLTAVAVWVNEESLGLVCAFFT